MRIGVDSKARVPLCWRIVATATGIQTLVAPTPEAEPEKLGALRRAGCEIVQRQDLRGRVDLKQLMRRLGERDITYLLIEGGSEVFASAFEARIVDEVIVFVAPKIIVGSEAKSPLAGLGIEEMSGATAVEDVTLTRFDDDILVEGRVRYDQRCDRE